MAAEDRRASPSRSFLGTGWSFPPRFIPGAGNEGETRTLGQVATTSDAEDVEASLRILFGTARGERFLLPKYGLRMDRMLFEPSSTTMRTLLEDQIRTALLLYEPRIRTLSLVVDTSRAAEGSLLIQLEYEIRATNSRYNLVVPYAAVDANEIWRAAGRVP